MREKCGVRESSGWHYRVAFAVPDLGRGFEKKTWTFPGGKDNIDIVRLCCSVRGGLQTCVDGLKDVSLDEIVTNITGGTEDGFEGGTRCGLREMWIDEVGEKGPPSVFRTFDADGGDASVLVEERVHVPSGKGKARKAKEEICDLKIPKPA